VTNDPSLIQIGTRNSLSHKFATSRSLAPLSGPIFLTLEEVVERYRGRVREGTRRIAPVVRDAVVPSFDDEDESDSILGDIGGHARHYHLHRGRAAGSGVPKALRERLDHGLDVSQSLASYRAIN
jgi:hypothetical protein